MILAMLGWAIIVGDEQPLRDIHELIALPTDNQMMEED